jgi:hypothetical protein
VYTCDEKASGGAVIQETDATGLSTVNAEKSLLVSKRTSLTVFLELSAIAIEFPSGLQANASIDIFNDHLHVQVVHSFACGSSYLYV